VEKRRRHWPGAPAAPKFAAMPLHILKLCVGAETIRDLEDWIAKRMALRRSSGGAQEHIHTTRMVPKRVDEIVTGGSLYWVIKGQVSGRQRLTAIRPFTDADGIGRCHLVMEPLVVPVEPRPCRPFQGWRYLQDKDVPRDIGERSGDLGIMPEQMRRELAELGLL
jgi:hypothetical protein